jgi:hypothetical protein
MVNILSKIEEDTKKNHNLLLDTDHNKRFNPFIQSHVYSKGGKNGQNTTPKSLKNKNKLIKNNKVALKKNVISLHNEKL